MTEREENMRVMSQPAKEKSIGTKIEWMGDGKEKFEAVKSYTIDLVTDKRSRHYGEYELNYRLGDGSLGFRGYFKSEEKAIAKVEESQ